MNGDLGSGSRLSPFDEMELADIGVREAELDEERTMFDPMEHPKDPHPKEEGVTDMDGKRLVDIQEDTPNVDLPNLDLDDAADILGPL